MNATITLEEYLDKKKVFVVPNYQRGYVWGKNNDGKPEDAVTHMIKSLLKGYTGGTSVFIQGVTVSEQEKSIILIDGQQRTTFFYLLLKLLGSSKQFQIQYDIRKESNDFLSRCDILQNIDEADEEYQDIYFFKKTLRVLSEQLPEDIDKDKFIEYILKNVKFLYIDIAVDKATTVFSMMNGNKAEMKAEELIKAELLRLASLNTSVSAVEKEQYAIEWDHNMLRSRYAREWDKWLQWWDRKDVKDFFKVDSVMGLLVSTYQMLKPHKKLTFESFRQSFLENQVPIEAKTTFDQLRRVQKRFEDAFNNPIVYNRVGAILRVINDREAFIKWYFLDSKPSDDLLERDDLLKRYYKLAFLGMTHLEITEKSEEEFSEKFDKKYRELESILSSDSLYTDNPDETFRLLLRLNIDEDCRLGQEKGRKFDFTIWDAYTRGRSLEHIYPKSKVYHIETLPDGTEVLKNGSGDDLPSSVLTDPRYIDRESCRYNGIIASEHSIGNLVLLYRDENSAFNDKPFEQKKQLFFNAPELNNRKDVFKSRHLLHTIYKFASSTWTGVDIAKNKEQTLKDFRKYYYGKK